jgi:glycosyltransferase involved in cell wall biosynthesis
MRIVLDLQGAQSDSRFRGIGRYSLALAQAIAHAAGEHEVWLALNGSFPDSVEPIQAAFADLVPREHVRVFKLPGAIDEADLRNTWRMQAAELLREKFLADLRPDIVHLSTLFEGCGNEVASSIGRLDAAVPTALTLYDLIPIVRAETYLTHPAVKRSYLRRAQSLKRADLLLAISEATRQEAIDIFQILPQRIVNIAAGVSPWFRSFEPPPEARTELMARCGLWRPFLLYTGGTDPRKNLEGLVAAFALLPEDLRTAYQLAMVGKQLGTESSRLSSFAKKQGLADDGIVCIDYASDEDLRLLYNTCALFVLPSLHEGFGLPLLEAMACGAPVIGSNCTSIPEIIDRQDLLFDPKQPKEIAGRMAEVLSNAEFRNDLKAWGFERVKQFTWEASAHKALNAFEALHAARNAAHISKPLLAVNRPLLAFVSPLPPEKTASADYSAKLLPNLARFYEIICVIDQAEVTDPWITAEFPIRDLSWFEANAERFQRVLYHFGNSSAHKHMFALLERHPGIVVLHDFYLSSVLSSMETSGFSPGIYTKALYDSHGYFAVQADRIQGRKTSISRFPCNFSVLRDSVGIINRSKRDFELARIQPAERLPELLRLPAIHRAPQAIDNPDQKESHHPEQLAQHYRDIVEEIYRTSPKAREQRLADAIPRILAPATPSEEDLASVAVALANDRERFGLTQILIDVTVLSQHDAKTGIQRVTRAILVALLSNPPPGFRIEPIRAVKDHYLYARRFTCRCLGLVEDDLNDDPVEIGHGDIILSIEWAAHLVPSLKPWFLQQRRDGVEIFFVVYDLLPLLRPELFPPAIERLAKDWIRTVAEVADGVVCISRTVADELYHWLSKERPQRLQALSLGFFHLGADLHASLPSVGLVQDATTVLAKVRSCPSFLMVGTVEPRKGHRQALAAMEQLWAEGLDVNLVIVGTKGWMMDDLEERVLQHPEHDHHLFWLQAVSDAMLEQIYTSASALLAASEAEGFGLPLVEAAQCGLPIIARDIPVFREVAGQHAYYFSGQDARSLAVSLQAWLSLGAAIPASTGMSWLTWQQSSRQLLDVLLHKGWYRYWIDTMAKPLSTQTQCCQKKEL